MQIIFERLWDLRNNVLPGHTMHAIFTTTRTYPGHKGWVASGPNARKDTINFSLLTEVYPMIETFPLEQVSVAYEKMMNAKVRFRAVLTMGELK